MANLTETSTYDAGVYQLEVTDPATAGASGILNTPFKNLANRTKYLKTQVDTLPNYATKVGVETLTNKTITETVYALTGTAPAILATNGAVQTWTLTAASAPTDSLTTGQSVILVVTPGAFAITWPSVVWTKQGGSGAAPSLFTSGKTSVVLWKVGTALYGSHLGDTA